MTPQEIISSCGQFGCRAMVDGENVRVLGDVRRLPAETVSALRIHKAHVVHELRRLDRIALCRHLVRRLAAISTSPYDQASEVIGMLTTWEGQLGHGLAPGEAWLESRKVRLGSKLRTLLPDIFEAPPADGADLEGHALVASALSVFHGAQPGEIRSASEALPMTEAPARDLAGAAS